MLSLPSSSSSSSNRHASHASRHSIDCFLTQQVCWWSHLHSSA
jgi:hypothetical protein